MLYAHYRASTWILWIQGLDDHLVPNGLIFPATFSVSRPSLGVTHLSGSGEVVTWSCTGLDQLCPCTSMHGCGQLLLRLYKMTLRFQPAVVVLEKTDHHLSALLKHTAKRSLL